MSSADFWSHLWTVLLAAGAAAAGTLAFLSKSRDFLTEPRQKRFEVYRKMSEDFDNPVIQKVREAINSGSTQAMNKLAYKEKVYFCAFYEELALVVYSRLLKPETANYMFGALLLKCYQSEAFWGEDFPRGQHHWSLFETFAKEMAVLGKRQEKALRSKHVMRLGV